MARPLDTQPEPNFEEVRKALSNCHNVLDFFREKSDTDEKSANGEA